MLAISTQERHEAATPSPREEERDAARRLPRAPDWLFWLLAAVVVGIVVGRSQIPGRAPLVWDEAARVKDGAGLAYALDDHSLGGVWDWINAQTFYPFLSSFFHGLTYWITNDALVAAWLPSLLAYSVCGLLVAKLARELGANRACAVVAAALFWFAPVEFLFSAGAFTEPLGACFLTVALIATVRLQRAPAPRAALFAGAVVGLTCWLKYDYGLLAAMTFGLTGLITCVMRRDRATLGAYGLAVVVLAAVIGGLLAFNFTGKLGGASDFIGGAGPGGADDFVVQAFSPSNGVDFGFYPDTFWSSDEVGLSTLAAVLLAGGLLWGVVCAVRRPQLRPVVVLLGLWFVIYSMASVKFARFMAIPLPAVAALAGAMVAHLWERVRLPNPRHRAALAWGAAVLLAIFALAPQAKTLDKRLWFLSPDPPAEAALAFVSQHLGPSDRPLVYLNPTNEFSFGLVQLAWDQKRGGHGSLVEAVDEAAPADRLAVMRDRLRGLRPEYVLGLTIAPGAHFDTTEQEQRFGSQPTYVSYARQFERQGDFQRVARLVTDEGRLQVTLWRMLRIPRRD